jgi:two-component system sensor histidine kinase TctE
MKQRRARARPAGRVVGARHQRSLFGEILNWMLAPLILMWPVSVVITYFGAQNIANAPYDRALANTLLMLTQQVRKVNDTVALDLTDSTQAILRGDETDSMFYLVLGHDDQLLGGDRELPLPVGMDRPLPGVIQYRDASLRGFDIRVAYTWVDLRIPDTRPVLVEVAETLGKRAQLANQIVRGVIIPQLIILPVAILMVWFGLTRGIRPLNALQARLRARRPDDLSPIATREVPQEITPLVAAMNDLLARQADNVQAQRRFVADAAHQLKTPLAGLRTQAELALRHASPQDIETCLHHLIEGSERATRLVNQLLALARAEDSTIPALERVPVDLQAIAREQTLARVHDAMTHGIDLGLEGDETPVMVAGNALLLGELASNLIDNALRYTPRGGTVTVRVHTTDTLALLEVEDSGPGIAPDERERVFDRVLGTAAEGSGLGLAIVREIAQRHGADVSLGDNPLAPEGGPPGTRFTVTLAREPQPGTTAIA